MILRFATIVLEKKGPSKNISSRHGLPCLTCPCYNCPRSPLLYPDLPYEQPYESIGVQSHFQDTRCVLSLLSYNWAINGRVNYVLQNEAIWTHRHEGFCEQRKPGDLFKFRAKNYAIQQFLKTEVSIYCKKLNSQWSELPSNSLKMGDTENIVIQMRRPDEYMISAWVVQNSAPQFIEILFHGLFPWNSSYTLRSIHFETCCDDVQYMVYFVGLF